MEDSENTLILMKGGDAEMKMRTLGLIMIGAALCWGLPLVAMGASSDNHDVTVQVLAINEVAISGGNITLTINSATPGSDPDDAVDNASCDIDWTTNEVNKKITVVTSNGAQNFTLKVVAQNVVGGTAAPEVTLSTTAASFVTGISQTVGNCDLQYTASATAAQGTGSDLHTVTYTITDV
jgi:hypothetical protein